MAMFLALGGIGVFAFVVAFVLHRLIPRAPGAATGSNRSRLPRAAAAVLGVLVFAGLAPALLVLVEFPTTFNCGALIDAMPEAHLTLPGAKRLSYERNEGHRNVLSGAHPPGFRATYLVDSAKQDAAIRWYDDQLQALGWLPLNRLPDIDAPGIGPSASVTSAAVFVTRRGPEYLTLRLAQPTASAADGASLEAIYSLTDAAALPGCGSGLPLR